MSRIIRICPRVGDRKCCLPIILSIETPTPLVLGVGFFCASDRFCDICAFGRRLSWNFCVEEYLHCVRRLLALQALFLLRRLLPLAETSSGVSLPGTSSSSSLPLGGQGMQEGSQGAPGVLSGGASSPPARSRSSGRGGGASGLLSGARSLFSFSFGSGRSGGCPLAVGFLFRSSDFVVSPQFSPHVPRRENSRETS